MKFLSCITYGTLVHLITIKLCQTNISLTEAVFREIFSIASSNASSIATANYQLYLNFLEKQIKETLNEMIESEVYLFQILEVLAIRNKN